VLTTSHPQIRHLHTQFPHIISLWGAGSSSESFFVSLAAAIDRAAASCSFLVSTAACILTFFTLLLVVFPSLKQHTTTAGMIFFWRRPGKMTASRFTEKWELATCRKYHILEMFLRLTPCSMAPSLRSRGIWFRRVVWLTFLSSIPLVCELSLCLKSVKTHFICCLIKLYTLLTSSDDNIRLPPVLWVHMGTETSIELCGST
jgi:hypothetical protein